MHLESCVPCIAAPWRNCAQGLANNVYLQHFLCIFRTGFLSAGVSVPLGVRSSEGKGRVTCQALTCSLRTDLGGLSSSEGTAVGSVAGSDGPLSLVREGAEPPEPPSCKGECPYPLPNARKLWHAVASLRSRALSHQEGHEGAVAQGTESNRSGWPTLDFVRDACNGSQVIPRPDLEDGSRRTATIHRLPGDQSPQALCAAVNAEFRMASKDISAGICFRRAQLWARSAEGCTGEA